MDWCHVTFASASGAMAAQRALKGVCPVVVMPALRQVTAGCGIALRVEVEDVEKVKDAFLMTNIQGWTLYSVTGSGKELRCRKL